MIIRFVFIEVLFTVVLCGDLFSSVAELESLSVTDVHLTKLVDEYIAKETDRLNRIKQLLIANEQSKEHAPFSDTDLSSEEESFGNPIDAFRRIKRIVLKRDALLGLLKENTSQDLLNHLNDKAMPTEVDVDGAAVALLRLQDTYQLDPVELADGKIASYSQTIPMHSDDTFQIGSTALFNEDYYHAIQWLSITKEKMEKENKDSLLQTHRSFNLTQFYNYISYALYNGGHVEHALWYSRALSAIDPDHPSAEYLKIYEQAFNESGREWNGSWENLPKVVNERPMENVFLEYEALCRGEPRKTPGELSKLYCFRQRNTAFLWLAPMNVEIMSFSPYVVIFRGILRDSESEHLKVLASPKLKRATVLRENGQSEVVSHRVVKSMFLDDGDDPLVGRISNRLSEVTGLSMATAEQLQMANYGLGGHYAPHFDMTINENTLVKLTTDHGIGNRIATGLFYMSQPAAGGATAFMEIGLTVFPSKNDCLFWFNLHRNGRPDMRTGHAGCPVLLGQKWVANKWIHERDQEFLRPCDLDAHL